MDLYISPLCTLYIQRRINDDQQPIDDNFLSENEQGAVDYEQMLMREPLDVDPSSASYEMFRLDAMQIMSNRHLTEKERLQHLLGYAGFLARSCRKEKLVAASLCRYCCEHLKHLFQICEFAYKHLLNI